MANYETLEAALERILQLEEELRTVTGERDTANDAISQLNTQLNEVREINQRYFNRLTQEKEETEKEEPEVISCEDFARTINI